MIRQTHTYLVSAMSGATLIAIAIAFFVVLVSAQVFHDWPISGLGGGGGEKTAAVAKAAPAGAPGAVAASSGVRRGAVGLNRAAGRDGKPPVGSHLKSESVSSQGSLGSDGGQLTIERGGSGGGSAGSGSGSATPASSPSPSSSSATNVNTGSSSAGGGSGAAAGGGSASGSAGTTPSPSGQVTETVNNTVSKVNETVLGGTLHETGVTEVTEGVVKGVAGPESPVGHVVDETVGAVGGLLPGNR